MSILDTIKEIASQALAHVDTLALYEGTVEQQRSDGTLDVKLDDPRFGPGVTALDMVFGLPGVTAEVPKGTRVAVGFHGGRRDLPVVRHYLSGTPISVTINATDKVTVNATEVLLGDAPQFGVARITDTVQAGPFAGVITGGSTTVKAGL